MNDSERRAFKRFPVSCKVSYFYLPPSSNPPTFQTLNLSLGGACVEAPEPLVPGSSVAFHLITPSRYAADVRAQVVFSKPAKPALYHVGVRFTTLSTQDRAILADEIERAAA